MLDPQRAVLVEGGDALGRRHELRAALGRGRLHELDDRLLGGPSFHDGSGSVCAKACAANNEAANANTPAPMQKTRRFIVVS